MTEAGFGAIADDVTGATDLASWISRSGRQTVLSFGLPRTSLPASDAIVLATKSRMLEANEARTIALDCAKYLKGIGVDQLYFKYCSTFDSTERGNIGPVIDVLLDWLRTNLTIACPSYPAYGRTVYQGHLFVGDRLLSESSMRHHPLTPMTDSNLVRFLGRQSRSAVGLLGLMDVAEGSAAIKVALERAKTTGVRVLIADAVSNRNIAALAEATADLPLVTGGAPLGGALAARRPAIASPLPRPAKGDDGPAALLSGSCSAATLAQVSRVLDTVPARLMDPVRLMERGRDEIEMLLDWATDKSRQGDFLIYSTADSDAVGNAQSLLGREVAGRVLEDGFGQLASGLAGAGVRRFVVAGGETSGAVIQALNISTLAFGEELDQGVPWTYSLDPPGYTFALKSGNFGGPDFFLRAIAKGLSC